MRPRVPMAALAFGAVLVLVLLTPGFRQREAGAQTGNEPITGAPNPAAVYCIEQGGAPFTRLDAVGNAVGYCLFDDGSECPDWDYANGVCAPGQHWAMLPAHTYRIQGWDCALDAGWALESDFDLSERVDAQLRYRSADAFDNNPGDWVEMIWYDHWDPATRIRTLTEELIDDNLVARDAVSLPEYLPYDPPPRVGTTYTWLDDRYRIVAEVPWTVTGTRPQTFRNAWVVENAATIYLPDGYTSPGDYRLLYDQEIGVLVQFTRTDQVVASDGTEIPRVKELILRLDDADAPVPGLEGATHLVRLEMGSTVCEPGEGDEDGGEDGGAEDYSWRISSIEVYCPDLIPPFHEGGNCWLNRGDDIQVVIQTDYADRWAEVVFSLGSSDDPQPLDTCTSVPNPDGGPSATFTCTISSNQWEAWQDPYVTWTITDINGNVNEQGGFIARLRDLTELTGPAVYSWVYAATGLTAPEQCRRPDDWITLDEVTQSVIEDSWSLNCPLVPAFFDDPPTGLEAGPRLDLGEDLLVFVPQPADHPGGIVDWQYTLRLLRSLTSGFNSYDLAECDGFPVCLVPASLWRQSAGHVEVDVTVTDMNGNRRTWTRTIWVDTRNTLPAWAPNVVTHPTEGDLIIDHPVSDVDENRSCGLDPVTFDAPATDPDGDPLHYRWYLNGEHVAVADDQPTWIWRPGDVPHLVEHGGSNYVEVKVSDGYGGEISYDQFFRRVVPSGFEFDGSPIEMAAVLFVRSLSHYGPGSWTGPIWDPRTRWQSGELRWDTPYGGMVRVIGDVTIDVEIASCGQWMPGTWVAAWARGPGRVQDDDTKPPHPDPISAAFNVPGPRSTIVRLDLPTADFYDGVYRIDILRYEPKTASSATIPDSIDLGVADPPVAYNIDLATYLSDPAEADIEVAKIYLIFANGRTTEQEDPEQIILEVLAAGGSDCAALALNVTAGGAPNGDPPTWQQALFDGFKGCAKGLILFEAADLTEGWCGAINAVVEEEHPLCIASKMIQTTLDTANALAIPIPPAYVVSELALNVWGCINDIGCNLYQAYAGSRRATMDEAGGSDLDLHAVDHYGAHVGMDYDTGVYKWEILGADGTGDVEGGIETISVPVGVDAHFYVDARDAEEAVETYVFTVEDIAEGVAPASDTVEQEIRRGERLEHVVTAGDGALSVAAGAPMRYGDGICDDDESIATAPIDCDLMPPILGEVRVADTATVGEPLVVEADIGDDGEVAVAYAVIHAPGAADGDIVFLAPGKVPGVYQGSWSACTATPAGPYAVDLVAADAAGNTAVAGNTAATILTGGAAALTTTIPEGVLLEPESDGGGFPLLPVLGIAAAAAAAAVGYAVARRRSSRPGGREPPPPPEPGG